MLLMQVGRKRRFIQLKPQSVNTLWNGFQKHQAISEVEEQGELGLDIVIAFILLQYILIFLSNFLILKFFIYLLKM